MDKWLPPDSFQNYPSYWMTKTTLDIIKNIKLHYKQIFFKGFGCFFWFQQLLCPHTQKRLDSVLFDLLFHFLLRLTLPYVDLLNSVLPGKYI